MTRKEWINLKNIALRLIQDEDAVQDILFEIARRNLTYLSALSLIRFRAKGSAFHRRKKEALNHQTLSIYSTPENAEDCTLQEIISSEAPKQDQEFEIEEFKQTLTEKENQILILLEEGFTIREICKKLKISSKTCVKIITSIREKATIYFDLGKQK